MLRCSVDLTTAGSSLGAVRDREAQQTGRRSVPTSIWVGYGTFHLLNNRRVVGDIHRLAARIRSCTRLIVTL